MKEKIASVSRMRGLTPLGSDRFHRSYWALASVPDVIFVQSLKWTEQPGVEEEEEEEEPVGLQAGCVCVCVSVSVSLYVAFL